MDPATALWEATPNRVHHQGDANEFTDQEGTGYPPIQKEWIAGVMPTIGEASKNTLAGPPAPFWKAT